MLQPLTGTNWPNCDAIEDSAPSQLELPWISEDSLQLRGTLGSGTRATAWLAGWQGCSVVVKRYHPEEVIKHRRRFRRCIAEYEFQRNQRVYDVPSVRPWVARPIGLVWDSAHRSVCFAQEHIAGPTLDWWISQRNPIVGALIETLENVVRAAASAGIHDLDLKPHNIAVQRTDEGWRPVLFDFNSVPHFDRAPNPIVALLYRLGVRDRTHEDRGDLKKLRALLRDLEI